MILIISSDVKLQFFVIHFFVTLAKLYLFKKYISYRSILNSSRISSQVGSGLKIFFGVFRVKNHDSTPKNHIFFQFQGARAAGAPPLVTLVACRRHSLFKGCSFTHQSQKRVVHLSSAQPSNERHFRRSYTLPRGEQIIILQPVVLSQWWEIRVGVVTLDLLTMII